MKGKKFKTLREAKRREALMNSFGGGSYVIYDLPRSRIWKYVVCRCDMGPINELY